MARRAIPPRGTTNRALDQSLLAGGTFEAGLGNRAGSRRRLLPQQARDAIVAAVRAERLEVGAKLPSEFVLAERLGVSRSTIREAMKLLEQDGVVEVRRGTGSFVSVAVQLEPERPITQFESITNMMRALGRATTTVVLDVKLRRATARRARGARPSCRYEGGRDQATTRTRGQDPHLFGEPSRQLGPRR